MDKTGDICGNPFVIGSRARFTVIHRNCIRIEDDERGCFVDEPSLFAVRREARCSDFRVRRQDGCVLIDTGAIRLEYRPDGQPLGPDNLRGQVRHGRRWVSWKPGQASRANLGGAAETLDGWSGARKLEDGLLSRDGWFVLDDSAGPLLVDSWATSRTGRGRDWYLFGYGSDYKAAFQAFAAVAGPVPMPRRYTLGAWYSRYWPYTDAEFRQIVQEYEQKGFPLDMIVMDMDWHIVDPKACPEARAQGTQIWTGYTWNRKLLPEPEKLIRWFHEQGLHVTLNDHPSDGVQPHEEMYEAFMRDMGADPKGRRILPFDAGDRRYLETFYKHTHAPQDAIGVDFWWLDWQQYKHTRSVPDLTNLQWLNHEYYRRSRRDGIRGASFSRWAGWGDHRHPIHFSGDANTCWRMLAAEVPFTAASGNSGCFFWSHDIGGHQGLRNEESYTRWCQFGALSAALRSHSTKDADKDRRPWTYPKWAEDSMRRSFRLRSELFPYIYSSVAQSCRDTIPLNRPMYLAYPRDEDAYSNPQQYLFGDHLLVAPIAEPGIGPCRLGRQVVWFPAGTWYNFFTGERFEGPCERLVAAEIDEFPLYARAGAPIAMQPYTPRMATEPIHHLVVRCWPGEEGVETACELYEDDGLTEKYMSGQSARTPLTYVRRGDHVMVTIGATVGQFDGQVPQRSVTVELPATRRPVAATLDGMVVQVRYNSAGPYHQQAVLAYDAATQVTRVELPARSIRQGCQVQVQVAAADPAEAECRAFARRAGLDASAAGKTVARMLQQAMIRGTPEQRQLACAAAGIGLFEKNETFYGIPAEQTFFVFAPPGLPVDRQVSAGVRGTVRRVDLPGDKTRLDHKAFLTDLPRPADELLFPRRDAVHLEVRLTVAGQPVEYTQEIPFERPYWSFERNLAPSARATASSEWPNQPATAAIDGVVDGGPGDQRREWASSRECCGAWLKLEWAKPVTVGRILLFDRPNHADHVVAGRLVLGDGAVLPVGELPADGRTPFEVTIEPRKIRWLVFVVTEVSAETGWVGLSEVAVYAE